MAAASPVVTGAEVNEKDTSAVNAVFTYSLPGLAAPETYDWALIPHRLQSGTDFTPYQATQTYPAGPASSGTVLVPVLPDLIPEEHGELHLIARPATAASWAESMSPPASPQVFNSPGSQSEVLYWQDDLIVTRRRMNTAAFLDTYERAADGSIALRSTMKGSEDLYFYSPISVSRYAMVLVFNGSLQTWLRNPADPFSWVRKPNLTKTNLGQALLAGDRMLLGCDGNWYFYRLDPEGPNGWRLTGDLGFQNPLIFTEDLVVVGDFGTTLHVLERTEGMEDSWKPTYAIPNIPTATSLLATAAEGMIVVPGETGLEIHERLPSGGGWARIATLPVVAREGGYEASLALTGDWLAVGRGLLFEDNHADGTVELFQRDAVNRSVWNPAGTLQGPGAGYGKRVLWNRGELVSMVFNGYSANPVVVRKFQGGTVEVRDNDRSKLAVSVASHLEPVLGSGVGEAYAELPLPAEADMLVSYEYLTGSAVAGQDFTGVDGNILITKGRSRAYLPFTLLADDIVEPDEFLTIRVGTTGQAPLEASAFIRSSDMPPVVIGTATPLLEGLGESAVTLRQVPVTGTTLPTDPVSVVVRINGIDSPPAALPLSTQGADLPGIVSTPALSAAAPAVSIHASAAQDELVEPAEEAVSATFALPEGQLSPGTLGLAHEGLLPPLPVNVTGPPGMGSMAAGAGWIFAVKNRATVDNAPAAGIAICYRISETGSPRLAMTQILTLQVNPDAPTQLSTDGETLALSGVRTVNGVPRDVLMVYKPTGPPVAPWELGFEWFGAVAGDPGVGKPVELIDGNYISWGVFLFERCTGSWPWRLINHARINQPVGDLQDTDGQWLIFKSVTGEEVRAYQRTRGALPGWVLKNKFLHPDGVNFREVHLRDQTLFVQEYQGDWRIYRESASGIWELEQTLPSSVSVPRLDFLTGSTVAGGGSLYTRTGPAAAPWVLSGQLPVENSVSTFSNRNQTLLQMFEGNTDTPRIRLYKAGLPLAVVDDDSLVYSIAYPGGFSYAATESYGGEAVYKMLLSVNRTPPFEESVRVHSRDTGSAMAGADYAPVDFRLVCGPRASIPFVGVEFPIRVFSDRMIEGQETFGFVIDTPVFGKAAPPHTFTLADPQTTGGRTPTGATALHEPPSGSMMQSVEYILQAAPDRDVTLTPSLSVGGTATSGTDFTLPVAPLLLKAGANRVRVPVLINADALDEGSETIFLKMSCLEMPQSSQNLVLTIIDATVPGLAGDEGYTTTQGTLLNANGQGGAPAGVQANDPAPPAGVYLVNNAPIWGSVTMQSNGDFTAVPGPNAFGDLLFSYRVETIPYRQYLDRLAPWRYLHPVNGVSPAVANPAFPSTWANPEFNDTTWPGGSGTISYGGLAAPVSPNAVSLAVPPSGARYTTYFRTAFSSETAVTLPLRIKLYCDDAAIVYINGVERGRLLINTSAAFATAPDAFTLLSGTPGQADTDEAILRNLDLPSVPLLAGSNVLAISLHNSTATSSDLGLRLESLEAGIISDPVPVRLTVTEIPQPPAGTPDVFACPQNSTFLSSDNYGPGVMDNDGLRGPAGSLYDPVTELVFSGVSTGTLTMIGTDGHFQYTPPPDFSGSAGFTYQIRDKDGLSAPVLVTLNVHPALPYDLWRQQLPSSGGGSTSDADGDGWNNFLEYATGSSPTDPAFPTGYGPGMVLSAPERVPGFSVELIKAPDLAWMIECAVSPDSLVWERLMESRGLNYRFTHSGAGSILRNETAGSFVVDVWSRTTLVQRPRLFYRLRTERIPPQ